MLSILLQSSEKYYYWQSRSEIVSIYSSFRLSRDKLVYGCWSFVGTLIASSHHPNNIITIVAVYLWVFSCFLNSSPLPSPSPTLPHISPHHVNNQNALFSCLCKNTLMWGKTYPYLDNRYQNNIVIDYRSKEAITLSHSLKGVTGII